MLQQIEMKLSSSHNESEQLHHKAIPPGNPLAFKDWKHGLEPPIHPKNDEDFFFFLHHEKTMSIPPPPLFFVSQFPTDTTQQKIPATCEDDTTTTSASSVQSKTTSSNGSHHDFDDLGTLLSEDISEEEIFTCSSFSMEPKHQQEEPWWSSQEEDLLQTLINKVESAGFIVIPAGEATSSKGVLVPQEWCPDETTEEQTGMISAGGVLPQIDAIPPFDPFEEGLSKSQVRISSSQDSCGSQEILDLEYLLDGYCSGEQGEANEDKDSPRIESVVEAEDDQMRATKNHVHADLRPKQEEGSEERPLLLNTSTSPPDASPSSEIVSANKKTVVVRPPMPVAASQKECKRHDQEEVDDAQAVSPKGRGRSPPTTDDRSSKKEEKQQGPRKRKSARKVETKGGVTTPTDKDILSGRGGQTNHFAGNKRYRSELTKELKELYKKGDKVRKTDISELFVEHVHGYGGRFLTQKDGLWFEITDEQARKRVSQALREDNTPEARAAKRQRYSSKNKTDHDKTKNPSGQSRRKRTSTKRN